MPSKTTAIKNAVIVSAYLLVIWGFYRFIFKLPEEYEELLIKPFLWLGPVFYFVKKEKLGLNSLGITHKNLYPAIYLALIFGAVFVVEGVLVNYLKYQGIEFKANIGDKTFLLALLISVGTAISEELTFRGFLFNRFWHALGSPWFANMLTTIVWVLLHIPFSIFWLKLDLSGTIGFLFLTGLFSIGSGFVFTKTKNVFSSILLHFLWSWPIILFR